MATFSSDTASADKLEAAIDALGTIGERCLVSRRIVPGQRSFPIRKADDSPVRQGRLAGQDRPGAACHELPTKLLEDGASCCRIAIFRCCILDGHFDYDIGTHDNVPLM